MALSVIGESAVRFHGSHVTIGRAPAEVATVRSCLSNGCSVQSRYHITMAGSRPALARNVFSGACQSGAPDVYTPKATGAAARACAPGSRASRATSGASLRRLSIGDVIGGRWSGLESMLRRVWTDLGRCSDSLV